MARKRVYVTEHEILASEKYTAFTIQVTNDGVASDDDGRKVIKQGTIWPANDATARGIILNDVDVTHSSALASLMVGGYVYKDRLPVAPTTEAASGLVNITFVDNKRIPVIETPSTPPAPDPEQQS